MLPNPTTTIETLALNGALLSLLATHDSRWLGCIGARVQRDAPRSAIGFGGDPLPSCAPSVGAPGAICLRDVFIAGVGQTAVNKDPQMPRPVPRRGSRQGSARRRRHRHETDRRAVRRQHALGHLGQQQQLGGLLADYTGLAGIEAVTRRGGLRIGRRRGPLGLSSGRRRNSRCRRRLRRGTNDARRA